MAAGAPYVVDAQAPAGGHRNSQPGPPALFPVITITGTKGPNSSKIKGLRPQGSGPQGPGRCAGQQKGPYCGVARQILAYYAKKWRISPSAGRRGPIPPESLRPAPRDKGQR